MVKMYIVIPENETEAIQDLAEKESRPLRYQILHMLRTILNEEVKKSDQKLEESQIIGSD